MIKKLFQRRYESIVAPLSRIADELLALQEQNTEDNRVDTAVIEKLNLQVSTRDTESSQASVTRSKVLALIAP